ncbi:type VI secretion system Vgr family protein [Hyalangium versicolor]|uniref:type VI secretion system Vgr family protein n=1 Tax=Hyalangium versicolor TaxID=2861190 RepID=UPI001CCBAB6E|nr:type VI secretion system tip protein TssI/VgrG [Hyalangium versicolor]
MDLFTLTCDKLPPTTRVMKLFGSEGLSRLYSFTAELVIPGDEGLVFDMGEALNATAILHIHGAEGEERRAFHGVIASVDWVQQLADHSVYQVVLVPRLWRLGLSQHGNIFVGKNVKTILQDVLESNGFEEKKDFEFRMGATQYEELQHVAQYRESDLAFIMRRMEREGIYFFFEQTDDREKLVIIDDKQKQKASGSVRYLEQADDTVLRMEAFTAFNCRYQTRPGLVRLREYDYLRPTMDLKKEEPVSRHSSVEVVSHDDNYSTPSEGQRLARVRSQELKAREILFEGHGHTFEVHPGYIFDVVSHPRPSFNAKYLAVSIDHEGSQGVGQIGTEEEQPTYRIRVEAIPETVQYRPPRVTPIPRIYGTEMGTVDGEQDSPYAQIDSHGRYKVQVYFDENDPRNGKSSMWVRMLQPHGGPNEGFHFPLRKSTEVMLVFLGGDPDRPVIAGVVPNAHSPSPVTVDNATHNVILTGGGSRVEIEDNDGGQYIKITTPPESTLFHLGAADGSGNNVHLSSMGHELVELGGNLTVRVDGTMSEEIHQDVTENFLQKETKTVGSDRSLEVTGTEDTKIHGNQTIEALSDRVLQITGNQRHEVGVNDEHTVGADHSVQVTGNQLIQVTGTQTNQVTSDQEETVGGKLTQTVTGNVTQTHLANFTQTITGSQTVTVLSDTKTNLLGAEISFKAQTTSDTILGVKNENIITAKIDTVVGMAMETIVGLNLSTHIGPSIEYTAALQLGKRGISLSSLDVEVKNAGPRLENAAIWLGCAGITMFP